jgi:hypothetical protein
MCGYGGELPGETLRARAKRARQAVKITLRSWFPHQLIATVEQSLRIVSLRSRGIVM